MVDYDPPAKPEAHTHTTCDSLIRYAEFLGFGSIHATVDEQTNLRAIIAIHSTKRGPAIGGCRMLAYATVAEAIEDALRLAQMMSLKSAINNLRHGGAKAVLIKPKKLKDRNSYFEKFGEFINVLGGRYIAAVDSGTNTTDMDAIARKTAFVTCTSEFAEYSDPSPLTALGVRRAIEAAVKFKLGKDSLDGIRVAIQGAGHVGFSLAKELKELGARVIITDIHPDLVQRALDELKIASCEPNEIYGIECDVFSPCALGAILNLETINTLHAKIVAGSANNQLAHHHFGTLLRERGILYAPDFLINSGGLIYVSAMYDHGDIKKSLEQIKNIYHTVTDIFERSERENLPTNDIAEKLARERLRADYF